MQEFVQSANALGLGQGRGVTRIGNGHPARFGIFPAHPSEALLGQQFRGLAPKGKQRNWAQSPKKGPAVGCRVSSSDDRLDDIHIPIEVQ